MKVRMLARFGGQTGRKFEKGLEYVLPPDYAIDLVAHGLAEVVVETVEAVPEPEVTEIKEEAVPEPEPEPEPAPKVKTKAKK